MPATIPSSFDHQSSALSSTSFLDDTARLTSKMEHFHIESSAASSKSGPIVSSVPSTPPGLVASVSPDTSLDDDQSSASLSDDDLSSTDGKEIIMSDHKKLELAGKHKPEPLLTENPNRFVLFPIQDDDVS
jgi:hypothetical protein